MYANIFLNVHHTLFNWVNLCTNAQLFSVIKLKLFLLPIMFHMFLFSKIKPYTKKFNFQTLYRIVPVILMSFNRYVNQMT